MKSNLTRFFGLPSGLETFIACTEADFENRSCARENCAKLVRRAVPTSPRKFVRKMCGASKSVQRLCAICAGKAPAQFLQNTGVRLARMCVHKSRAIFAKSSNFSLKPSCTGKKCLKSGHKSIHTAFSLRILFRNVEHFKLHSIQFVKVRFPKFCPLRNLDSCIFNFLGCS